MPMYIDVDGNLVPNQGNMPGLVAGMPAVQPVRRLRVVHGHRPAHYIDLEGNLVPAAPALGPGPLPAHLPLVPWDIDTHGLIFLDVDRVFTTRTDNFVKLPPDSFSDDEFSTELETNRQGWEPAVFPCNTCEGLGVVCYRPSPWQTGADSSPRSWCQSCDADDAGECASSLPSQEDIINETAIMIIDIVTCWAKQLLARDSRQFSNGHLSPETGAGLRRLKDIMPYLTGNLIHMLEARNNMNTVDWRYEFRSMSAAERAKYISTTRDMAGRSIRIYEEDNSSEPLSTVFKNLPVIYSDQFKGWRRR